MMQAVNDNLEALVRTHMEQWFWIHRRWKTPKRPGGSGAPEAAGQPEPEPG